MAVNSSSNDSLLQSNVPDLFCLFTGTSSFVFMSFSITNILLVLPLCILVLNLGFQRWQKQRSNPTTATTSHSDSFTYHMVTMELIGVFGCTLCICAVYGDLSVVFNVGYNLWSLTWYGGSAFHVLTCVERYLAVVHPITYLKLRRERGIRIRNITLVCIWLLCIIELLTFDNFFILGFGFLIASLIVVAFCSLAVLRVLIHPGPGEQGGDRERVDQSKRRAFYTLMAILGVLLLRCCANLVWAVLFMISRSNLCVMMAAEVWLNLPSSLVLPLLFLHRAGKLACCKKITK